MIRRIAPDGTVIEGRLLMYVDERSGGDPCDMELWASRRDHSRLDRFPDYEVGRIIITDGASGTITWEPAALVDHVAARLAERIRLEDECKTLARNLTAEARLVLYGVLHHAHNIRMATRDNALVDALALRFPAPKRRTP